MIYLTILELGFNSTPLDATDIFTNMFFILICSPLLLLDLLFLPLELLSLIIFKIYERKEEKKYE